MSATDGMRMDMASSHALAKRGYLTINTSGGVSFHRGEVTYGADIVWTCKHLHQKIRAARDCAARQMRRIEKWAPEAALTP